jgi:hypothetical protein
MTGYFIQSNQLLELVDKGSIQSLKNKVVVITTTSSIKRDIERVTNLANELNNNGVNRLSY